jgi:hypothetical protein
MSEEQDHDIPRYLVDMRFAYVSEHPKQLLNDMQRHYFNMKRNDLGEFLKQYRAAERDYALIKSKGEPSAPGSDNLEMDEGTDRSLEVAKRWLEENK